MINYTDLNQVIENYGYDPFERIEEFILREIIPKYDCLISVHRSNIDECGFPTVDFYIRYNVKLSFKEWEKLDESVIEDIENFCKKNGIDDALDECTIFVTVSGDTIG
ncbi:hypothetical protein [Methanobrevibacter sp.]|uniref:hypothetical protein n=1 Tax=Methanobrevibacter sp. TaxID=66852 RepID=UPI0038901B72